MEPAPSTRPLRIWIKIDVTIITGRRAMALTGVIAALVIAAKTASIIGLFVM